MSIGRLVGVSAAVLAAVVALGATAHAAAGPLHEAAECVACAACEWLHALFS